MDSLQCQKIPPTNIVFVTLFWGNQSLSFLQESFALDSAQQVDTLLHMQGGNSSIFEELFRETLKKKFYLGNISKNNVFLVLHIPHSKHQHGPPQVVNTSAPPPKSQGIGPLMI